MFNISKIAKIKCIGVFLIVFPMYTVATEGGGSNYLPGFYGDFAMGIMPGKGTYFINFITAFQDKTSKTGTFYELPSIVQVTDYKIFGGNYIFGIYPGLGITKDYSGVNKMDRVGIVDAYLIPLAINWNWDSFSVLFYEGIIAPTGYYEKGALNIGRNIWTFDHILSLTWQLPADNEISITSGYMNNTKNYATGYSSGDEIHFDYNLGHYFSPQFALGVAGTYYRQVSADHAPTAILAITPSEASSIGPALMWTPHIIDRDVTISLKWLHEYSAQGRLAQDYLISRIDVAF
jgi:hypothetical protein